MQETQLADSPKGTAARRYTVASNRFFKQREEGAAAEQPPAPAQEEAELKEAANF